MCRVSRRPDVPPGLAAVGGPVDSVTVRDVIADARLAGPHVDDVRVRLGDRDGADRARAEVPVRHVLPVDARVRRLPHAARHRAEVERGGLRRMPRHRDHPPAPERPDAAPPHHPAQVMVLYSRLPRSHLVMRVHCYTSAMSWRTSVESPLTSFLRRQGPRGVGRTGALPSVA